MYLLVFDTLSLSLELTSLMLTFSFTHTLFQQYTVIYFQFVCKNNNKPLLNYLYYQLQLQNYITQQMVFVTSL